MTPFKGRAFFGGKFVRLEYILIGQSLKFLFDFRCLFSRFSLYFLFGGKIIRWQPASSFLCSCLANMLEISALFGQILQTWILNEVERHNKRRYGSWVSWSRVTTSDEMKQSGHRADIEFAQFHIAILYVRFPFSSLVWVSPADREGGCFWTMEGERRLVRKYALSSQTDRLWPQMNLLLENVSLTREAKKMEFRS